MQMSHDLGWFLQEEPSRPGQAWTVQYKQ